MKVIADENVFEPIIDFLKKEGHEVISVRHVGLSGASDDKIYEIAIAQQLVVITMDKDFSRMIKFPPERCEGIIVIKLYRMTVDKTTELFKQYFKTLDLARITHKLTIITPEGIKIRGRGI